MIQAVILLITNKVKQSYDQKVRAELLKQSAQDFQKTREVTGLSEKKLKKLLNEYTHSEIRQGTTDEEGKFVPKELFSEKFYIN